MLLSNLKLFVFLDLLIFPIMSEAWDGNKIYIGASYFNQLDVPIAIVLLLLMGIGSLLS